MKFLARVLILAALLIPFSAPALAYDPLGPACNGNSSAVCVQNKNFQNNSSNPANDIVQSATNIIAMAAGLAAVIIIIISGLTMVTSGGDQEKVKKARGTLMAAIIGLVIVAFAWVIVKFVIEKLVT